MNTAARETASSLHALVQLASHTLRAALGVLRISKTVLLAVALIASLALNIASLTIVPVFNALSSAISFVAAKATTDLVTVSGRHKRSIRNLDRTLSSQTRKTEALAKSNARLKRTVNQTTRRISGRIARATARSTASIAAESIPYLGIGVILGVTAWEVSDACDNMQDLHQLELAFNPDAAIDADHTEVCGTQVPTKDEILQSLKDSPSKAWNNAKTWASDLPSWEEAKVSAKDVWQDLIGWLRIALD